MTDGEQSRQHFVHGFLERLEGVDFSRRVTIGIRADRYKAEVPTVTAPIRRRGPIHGDEVRFARAGTARALKFTIPGPMTIVDTLADEYYRDRRRLALEFARVINEEARELAALGLDVLQLDEPAFNVYMDDVAAWGIEALHRAIEGVGCRTAVHICYGYGIKANVDWKATLGQQWRQYEKTFPLLAASRLDQVSLECANSRVPDRAARPPARQGRAFVGAVDVATNAIRDARAGGRCHPPGASDYVPPEAPLSVHELRGWSARGRAIAQGEAARARARAALVLGANRRYLEDLRHSTPQAEPRAPLCWLAGCMADLRRYFGQRDREPARTLRVPGRTVTEADIMMRRTLRRLQRPTPTPSS